MPFTPSHIAAILPFSRTPLLPAALAIGSMVPDLPYFVPIELPRGFTHSPLGALVADIPMGIVCYLLWLFVLRSALLEFSPRWLHDRFRVERSARSRWRTTLLVLAALAVGITTHLVWDSFTHADGWVVLHAAGFRAELGPFAVYSWLQYLSSVVGLVILAIWSFAWARRTAPLEQTYLRTTVLSRRLVWLLVVLTLAVVAISVWVSGLLNGLDAFDRSLVYHTAVYSIASAGVVGVVACLIWYVLPREGAATTHRARPIAQEVEQQEAEREETERA